MKIEMIYILYKLPNIHLLMKIDLNWYFDEILDLICLLFLEQNLTQLANIKYSYDDFDDWVFF